MNVNLPVLVALLGISGVLIGTATVVAAPWIAAHRLEESPIVPSWWMLVPLLGILVTRWRPWRAAITEIGLGVVFAGLALRYGPSARLLLASAFTALLALIAYIDLDYRLVLNRVSLPGVVLVLVAAWWWPGIGLLNALLGAAVGLTLFGILQIVGRGALGTGDTKLALLIGAMRGFPGVFNALIYGILLGGLGAVFFLMVLQRGRRESMAYAPFLSAGAVLSFFLSSP